MIWPEIAPGIPPALFYAFGAAAALVIGISKAGFGGGTGILAIPLMAAVTKSPLHMLGMLLPVLIVADALSNLHHLRNYEWRLLKPLLLGAMAGVIVGSAGIWLLRDADPDRFQRGLKLLIGAICLLFVGMQLYGLTGRKVPTLPPGRASSVGVGALSGFVSTFSHSAGPIATLYLLQEKVEKRLLVGTLLLLFLLVNVSKVPTYVALGIINGATLRDSLWMFPILPVGTVLGAWMNRRVPEKPFVAILYAAAAVTAAHMVWTSF